jgi:large subunit ribosomal protein L23
MRHAFEVIKRPVVTEKSLSHYEKNKEYTFVVAIDASKPEIKHLVQEAFQVKVELVRTCIVHRSIKRTGKFEKKLPNYKKAFVRLVPGHALSIYDSKNQERQ